MNNELASAIQKAFDATGFTFREGEWDMERASKQLANELAPFIANQHQLAIQEFAEKLRARNWPDSIRINSTQYNEAIDALLKGTDSH